VRRKVARRGNVFDRDGRRENVILRLRELRRGLRAPDAVKSIAMPGAVAVTDPRFYLVIDLEATTSDDGSLPPEQMETIEIGAVLVDTPTLAVVDEFQSFVRPIRRPKLQPTLASESVPSSDTVNATAAASPRLPEEAASRSRS